jgi:hypothetical protein
MLWRQGPEGWEKDEAEQRGREGIVAEDRLSLIKDGRDNKDEVGQVTCMGGGEERREDERAEEGASGGGLKRREGRDGLEKRISKSNSEKVNSGGPLDSRFLYGPRFTPFFLSFL